MRWIGIDFKKAGELVLAARINGIGPQIGALLEWLGYQRGKGPPTGRFRFSPGVYAFSAEGAV